MSDPMDVLPFEICLDIFRYLPCVETWRSQLVTRSWHRTLSSEQATEAAIRRWDTAKALPEDVKKALTIVKHHYMAKPARQRTIWIPFKSPEFILPYLTKLHGHRVSYVRFYDRSEARICVLDLKTQETKTYPKIEVRHRSQLHFALLTDHIVGVTVEDTVYWARHEDEELQHTRMPHNPDAAVAFGSTIAAVWGFNQPSIWMYDHRNGQVATIAVDFLGRHEERKGAGDTCYGLALDTKHVTVFRAEWPQSPYVAGSRPVLCVDRYTIDGVRKSSFTKAIDRPTHIGRTWSQHIHVVWTGVIDQYQLSFAAAGNARYDVLVDVEEGLVDGPQVRQSKVHWKGSIYVKHGSLGDHNNAEQRDLARIDTLRSQPRRGRGGSLHVTDDEYTGPSKLFVNDQFLVCLRGKKNYGGNGWFLDALSFDPDEDIGPFIVKGGAKGVWTWQAPVDGEHDPIDDPHSLYAGGYLMNDGVQHRPLPMARAPPVAVSLNV